MNKQFRFRNPFRKSVQLITIQKTNLRGPIGKMSGQVIQIPQGRVVTWYGERHQDAKGIELYGVEWNKLFGFVKAADLDEIVVKPDAVPAEEETT
jgi:hypothetical protein